MGNWKSALHVTLGGQPTRMLKFFSIPKYTEFFACGALAIIISIPFNIDNKFQYTPKSSTEISVLWSEICVYPRNFQYTFETLTEFSVYLRIFSLRRNLWLDISVYPRSKWFQQSKVYSSIIDQTIQYTQASLTEISVYPINSSIRIFCTGRDL